MANPAEGTLELTPMARENAALADTFAVDLTGLSSRTFQLEGFRINNDLQLVTEFSWTHPIPDPAIRKDLAAFDLRMHILRGGGGFLRLDGGDGLQAPLGIDGAMEPITIPDLPILNFDGWSSWGDEVIEPYIGEIPGNIYPFIRVHEDPARDPIDPDNVMGWNSLPQSPTIYEWDMTTIIAFGFDIDVILALEVSFGSSAVPSIEPGMPGSRSNPLYFNPEFNIKEAWDVQISLTDPLFAGVASSTSTMSLEIRDHQGLLPASGAFDPLTAPSTSMRYQSAPREIQIAIPGTLTEPLVIPGESLEGDGSPGNPFTFSQELTGDMFLGPEGRYGGVVRVIDTMSDAVIFDDPLPTKGFTRDENVVTRFDFAAYQVFFLQIFEDDNIPPISELEAAMEEVPVGEMATLLVGVGTQDPDGAIVLYEYDFDYDGLQFDVEAMQNDPNPIMSNVLDTEGEVTMAMRVTDNGVPAKSTIGTVDITVTPPAATWTDIHNMINNGDPAVGGSNCVQCHAGGAGGLIMNDDPVVTYNNLVSVDSGCVGLNYIEPFIPSTSLLFLKISQPNPPCGNRMPANGAFWTPDAIDMVNQWISSGAPGP